MSATVEEEEEDGNATLGRGKVIHRTQTEPGREREEGGYGIRQTLTLIGQEIFVISR